MSWKTRPPEPRSTRTFGDQNVVKLRLKRFGRRHSPSYRLCAMDIRTPRNGKAIEELGHFDPLGKNDDPKALNLNAERVKYWLSVGAQPTDTVRALLRRAAILPASTK